MNEVTLQKVLGLHDDKVSFILDIEETVNIDSENILYLHDKTNTKTHEIKSILQLIYKNKLVDPFKNFVNFNNRKLAVFHLERLRGTKNIPDVNNELSKITFLNTKQKDLLKKFMMLLHELDIKNIRIAACYKTNIKKLTDKILLSLINYIKELDLSTYDKETSKLLKSYKFRDPGSGYSRQIIFEEILRRYADSKELVNLLKLVSEGEAEQVKQVKIKDIPKEYILLITGLVNFDGNTEMMKALIEYVLLGKLNKSMMDSLLAKAVEYRNIDLAKYFLEKGVDPNPLGALDAAVRINRKDLVNLLLKYHAAPNVYYDCCVPLVTATFWGYKNIVKILLDHGADVNIKDRSGWSPLPQAIARKHFDIAKILIERGADINIQDQDNNTPLILATMEGNIKIVNLLLKKGANTDIKNTQMNTALHYASINGNIEIVQKLLSYNASVDVRNTDGNTPLGLASSYGHHVIVRLLLKKCTTPDWCSIREYFIFLYVISEGYIEVFKALLEHEPNLCNANVEEERATALMLALASENIEIVKILLQYNPDLEIQTTNGETALHLAVELGDLEIVEMLVRKGANIYTTNKDGISPLSFARCNNLKVMQILLKYGRAIN